MHYFQVFFVCFIMMGKNIESAHAMDPLSKTMIEGENWRARNFTKEDIHSFVDFRNDISVINQINDPLFNDANSGNLPYPEFFLKNDALVIESRGERSLERLLGLVMIQPSKEPGVGLLRYTIDRFFTSKKQECQIMSAIIQQWAVDIAQTKNLERIDALLSPGKTELMHLLEHFNFVESEAHNKNIQIDLFGLDVSDYMEGQQIAYDLFHSHTKSPPLEENICYKLIDVDSVSRCFSLSSITQSINYHFSFYLN